MKLKKQAQYVSTNRGCDTAWFYENAKSIDVYCHRAAKPSRWCRIPREMLASYIKRSKP